MKFKYKIMLSRGNYYGTSDIFTGEWNGMVRVLMDEVRTDKSHKKWI